MTDRDATTERGRGRIFAIVVVLVVAAGVGWWIRATPADTPSADGASVDMTLEPRPAAPLPRA